MAEKSKIEQLIDAVERIGVIGSPSSTGELALDVLGAAVERKLVGELALFHFTQDSAPHYALGQITEVMLRNIWHEDPTIRSLIRQRGRVDAVSNRQDTHQAQMTVSAVFAAQGNGYRPSSLGTVPATGTQIHVVDDNVLDELLKPYKSQLFYLGYVYGSKPKLPLWFKHFDVGPDGAGESYPIGIFGKTGSGKSVLAKMALVAYARHKQMGLFVLDPQGEFSMGLRQPKPKIEMGNILCQPILNNLARPVEIYDLPRLRLDSWEMLAELLVEFGFFEMLGVKSADYQEELAAFIIPALKKAHKLTALSSQAAFFTALDCIVANIHRIYAGEAGQVRVTGFAQEAKTEAAKAGSVVWERWQAVTQLFAERPGTEEPWNIVAKALRPTGAARPLVVIDLSRRPPDIAQAAWDEKIKPLLIDRFLDELVRVAEAIYHEGKSLNTLAVIDEAHRLAPEGRIENERRNRIRLRLVDAVRTTRKYGLGWMFISQTLASLDRAIWQQLRISFFGFGLGVGSELQTLREMAGGDRETLKLYQGFRDPQSAFETTSREYSFMTLGPVSPLSFAGTPLFLNAFNSADAFIGANNLKTASQELL